PYRERGGGRCAWSDLLATARNQEAPKERATMSNLAEIYLKARRHLGRRDAKLKAIINRIGPCTLQYNQDRFGCLARAIISQQISGKAAAAISGRLVQALGPKGIHARGILKMSDAALRKVGLSTNKCRAVRD